MPTHFFNNKGANTLFDKFKGLASAPNSDVNFHRFLAVVGFFRSSGYFKLRSEIECAGEIRILVGIDIDPIWKEHKKGTLFFGDSEKAKEIYGEEFIKDIKEARYSAEVEDGIMQMIEDVKSGRLKIRIHSSKKLHAKFYLCLPNDFSEHTAGRVIMGSSNISDSGLGITQPPTYELNVEMTDYDDVRFCLDEFERLWGEGVEVSAEDMEGQIEKTHIGQNPTPYEIYLKVLVDNFGDMVEDDFNMKLPDGVKDLKFQSDAVRQGFQMMMQHNGLILADVVGLGKTNMATMIAKRFVEANGKRTNILVVAPPALQDTWNKSINLFGLKNNAHIVTNGSLEKITGSADAKDRYKDMEEYDLIIVDEAHGFRNDDSGKYSNLQKICKSERANKGGIEGKKKVMLLSATPLNNRPIDLRNQLLLFQDQVCTIDGVTNLKAYFDGQENLYDNLMKNRDDAQKDVRREVKAIYDDIREKVLNKVTIRRTRNNILNSPDYKEDIEAQGIVFPRMLEPESLIYKMDAKHKGIFFSTLYRLTGDDDECLSYARYRAVQYFKEEQTQFEVAQAKGLAGIFKVLMVKRLESSFYAFKKSLDTLLTNTQGMIKMFEENNVLIIPKMNVRKMQADGMEIEDIFESALDKGYSADEIQFKAEDFKPEFLEMLRNDERILKELKHDWDRISDEKDAKFNLFMENMESKFLKAERNPTGKIIVFSESTDTLEYLERRLREITNREDILVVTSRNRNSLKDKIKENFDANYEEEKKKNEYNILLTSDVLAEGVDLHRSNTIVNYDLPWNATRLMQRLGRVNRIGSASKEIHNYMFYPSQEGDEEIRLYKNALIKIQSFHNALGEDAKIFSKEEIVEEFEMYDPNVKDDTDKRIEMLREIREVYQTQRKLYEKVKAMPDKSRAFREDETRNGETVVYAATKEKKEFYYVTENGAKEIDFIAATDILRAKPEEKSAKRKTKKHYEHVKAAEYAFMKAEEKERMDETAKEVAGIDKKAQEAVNILKDVRRETKNDDVKEMCDHLTELINKGIYNNLYKEVTKKLKKEVVVAKKEEVVMRLGEEFKQKKKEKGEEAREGENPTVILSETWV